MVPSFDEVACVTMSDREPSKQQPVLRPYATCLRKITTLLHLKGVSDRWVNNVRIYSIRAIYRPTCFVRTYGLRVTCSSLQGNSNRKSEKESSPYIQLNWTPPGHPLLGASAYRSLVMYFVLFHFISFHFVWQPYPIHSTFQVMLEIYDFLPETAQAQSLPVENSRLFIVDCSLSLSLPRPHPLFCFLNSSTFSLLIITVYNCRFVSISVSFFYKLHNWNESFLKNFLKFSSSRL